MWGFDHMSGLEKAVVPLIGEMIYRSREYHSRYLGSEAQLADDEQRKKLKHEPVDDVILHWLAKNTLGNLDAYFHNYLFVGRNGTSCMIHACVEENTRKKSLNYNYYWDLTIKYQPADREIPEELHGALSDLGFSPKINFI